MRPSTQAIPAGRWWMPIPALSLYVGLASGIGLCHGSMDAGLAAIRSVPFWVFEAAGWVLPVLVLALAVHAVWRQRGSAHWSY